ncbi:MAG: zinc-dependent alcohol dehydrogenase family protein [Deltaproteobacteria bacterium]|nr:zinc-dependent alcohol dehydrogenase family protein [Deltaproteobacteria bacterium]
MKAMVLHAPAPVEQAPLRQEQAAEPQPAAGEVLIAVEVCGVCHTDLHLVEGELAAPSLPLVPGHQIVGTVVGLGAGVDPALLRRRVGVPWLHQTCGACPYCDTGRENLCQSARFTGMHCDGGYAERCTAVADFLVELPEPQGDALQVAPLLCGGIIGYRSLRLSGVEDGQRLGLFGFGASAHIVIQIARARDLEVYVFTRNPHNQQAARRLGAAWVGAPDLAPRVLLDGAISFTPSGATLRTALERVRRGGTVACAGIYTDPIPPLDYQRHLYHEKVLRSVANATRQDATELMAAAVAARVRTDVEEAPLDQANQVLERLKHGQLRGSAAVLRIG